MIGEKIDMVCENCHMEFWYPEGGAPRLHRSERQIDGQYRSRSLLTAAALAAATAHRVSMARHHG